MNFHKRKKLSKPTIILYSGVSGSRKVHTITRGPALLSKRVFCLCALARLSVRSNEVSSQVGSKVGQAVPFEFK